MANYIVSNANFKPFSYAELVAPIKEYTEAYSELESALGAIDTERATIEGLLDETRDKESYEKLSSYKDALDKQASLLAQEGLKAVNRKQFLDLKSKYNKEINPINLAIQRRNADILAQKEAIVKDPGKFFGRMARDISIDDYVKDSTLDTLTESYNENLLTKQTAEAASALKNTLSERNIGELRSLGLPYQYQRMLQTGATADDIFLAMAKDPSASPFLLKIVDNTLKSSGIMDWKSLGKEYWKNPVYKRAEEAALRGLTSAIGVSKIEHFKDDAGLTKFQYDLMDRNAANKEARERAEKAQEAQNQLATNIALSGESYIVTSGKDKEYLKALEGLRGEQQGIKASLFGKDGKSNALLVYDEYRRAGKSNLTAAEISALEEEAKKRATARWRQQWGENIHPNQEAIAAQQLNTYIKQETNSAILNASRQKILKKHGVSQVLTPEQYNALKAIGYKGEQLTSMNQLVTGLNNLSKQKTYYSTNMSNYDIPDVKIRSTLANWEVNKSFAGRVYKMNTDGTRGEALEFDDLDLKSDKNNKGRKITGIYYSDVTPNMIIIQVGEGTGERYLVDPNALGTDVNSFIENARSNLSNVNSTERAQTITIGLAKMLNSYNPTASTTSSKV